MKVLFSFIVTIFSLQVLASNKTPITGDIYVMGDSLAYGYGAPQTALSPTNCLAKGFVKSQVTNLAVPGVRSEIFLMSMDEDLSKSKPQMVFLSMAGNDVIADVTNPGSYPAEKTLSEMTQIFDKLLSQGIMVVYLALNPPFPGAERLPEVTKLAQAKGILTIDGMDGLWQQPNLMSNQVHPNEQGYAIMCDKILQALQEYVP